MSDSRSQKNKQGEASQKRKSPQKQKKPNKKTIGFLGWLIMLGLVAYGMIMLALPRLDAGSPWAQRLSGLPVIGNGFGVANSDSDGAEATATNTDTDEADTAEAEAQATTEIAQDQNTDATIDDQDASSSENETDMADAETEATDAGENDEAIAAVEQAVETDEVEDSSVETTEDAADADIAGDAELAEADASSDQTDRLAQEEAKNAELQARIKELENELQSAQTAGQETASNTVLLQQQKAASDLKLAVLNGAPIATQVSALEGAGVEVPDALKTQAESAPTMIELQDDYGQYAMDAIRASIQAQAGDGALSGLTARVKSEFAGRSMTPQQGMTPDAVLSRAENSLREGDLEGALSEISILPSEAQEAMAPWTEQANQRLDVVSAIGQVTDSLGME